MTAIIDHREDQYAFFTSFVLKYGKPWVASIDKIIDSHAQKIMGQSPIDGYVPKESLSYEVPVGFWQIADE